MTSLIPNQKTELLSPAGNLEKLKYAIAYGADAVYVGTPRFSLRARADQFSYQDFAERTILFSAAEIMKNIVENN